VGGRAAVVAVGLAVAATAAGGCGGGGGGGGKTLPDPVAARASVTSFARAFATGDGKRACDLLTAAARASFLRRVQVLATARDCPTGIAKIHTAAGPDVNAALATAVVTNVRVTGSAGTATLTANGHATSVGLAKEGGTWRLTAFPGI
jgi:hypothetical protein